MNLYRKMGDETADEVFVARRAGYPEDIGFTIVPVVPDYEAAFRQRSPNYVITREEMKRYIDAALGAGNGDET